MRVALVIFPGSNCDGDVERAVLDMEMGPVDKVWHEESAFPAPPDIILVPGGFSYGDYLRPGALAAKSPLMEAVREHANHGGLVAGICNGFQILTEARLLPGALLTNASTRFICDMSHVRVERCDTPFTRAYTAGEIVSLPIAHHEGLYFLPPEDLRRLEGDGQVVFRYASPETGASGETYAPNGSLNGIAGIVNERGNVLGMMPHPERATLRGVIGGTDGRKFWESIMSWMADAGGRS